MNQNNPLIGGTYPAHLRQFMTEMGTNDLIDAYNRMFSIVRGNPRLMAKFMYNDTRGLSPSQMKAYRAYQALRNRSASAFSFQEGLSGIRPDVSFGDFISPLSSDVSVPAATAVGAAEEEAAGGWFDRLRRGYITFKHYASLINPIVLLKEYQRMYVYGAEAFEDLAKTDLATAVRLYQEGKLSQELFRRAFERWKVEDRRILEHELRMRHAPIEQQFEHWGNKIEAVFTEPVGFISRSLVSMIQPLVWGDENYAEAVYRNLVNSYKRSQGVGRIDPALFPQGVVSLLEGLEGASRLDAEYLDKHDVEYIDLKTGRLVKDRLPVNQLEAFQRLEQEGRIQIRHLGGQDPAKTKITVFGVEFNPLFNLLQTLEFVGNPVNWAYRPIKLGMSTAAGGVMGVRALFRSFKAASPAMKAEMLLTSPISTTAYVSSFPIIKTAQLLGLAGRGVRAIPAVERGIQAGAKIGAPILNKIAPAVIATGRVMEKISANLFVGHYVPDEYFTEGVNAVRTLKWWDMTKRAAQAGAFDEKNSSQAAEWLMEAERKFSSVQSELDRVRLIKERGEDTTEAVRRLADLLEDATQYTDEAAKAKDIAQRLRKTGDIAADDINRIQSVVGDYLGHIPHIVQNVFTTPTLLNIGKAWAKSWLKANAFIQRMSNHKIGRFFFPAYRFADPRNIQAERFTRLFKNALMGRANELREVVADTALAFSGSSDFKNTRLYRLHEIAETFETQALEEAGIAADRRSEFIEETGELFQDIGFRPNIFGEIRGAGMISGVEVHTAKQTENLLTEITSAVRTIEAQRQAGATDEEIAEMASALAHSIHDAMPQFVKADLAAKLSDDGFRQKWMYLTEGVQSFNPNNQRYHPYWGAISTMRRIGFSRHQIKELVKVWGEMNAALSTLKDADKVRQELGELMLNIANQQVYRPEDIVAAVSKITEGRSPEVKTALENAVLGYLNVRKQAIVSFERHLRYKAQMQAVMELNQQLQERRRIVQEAFQSRYGTTIEDFQNRGCL